METTELIGLVAAGPNVAVVAAVGGDPTWNVAADWGLGSDWKAVRVPVGIKFRRMRNGLVAEEVLVVRGQQSTHEKLLARSLVPTHLVLTDGPQNRLAPHFPYLYAGSDS